MMSKVWKHFQGRILVPRLWEVTTGRFLRGLDCLNKVQRHVRIEALTSHVRYFHMPCRSPHVSRWELKNPGGKEGNHRCVLCTPEPLPINYKKHKCQACWFVLLSFLNVTSCSAATQIGSTRSESLYFNCISRDQNRKRCSYNAATK